MAYIRDPRFSMSLVEPAFEPPTAPRPPRVSFAKHFERRMISVWKIITRSTRKQPRDSFIHSDFVVITARRRSTIRGPRIYRV